MAPSSTYLLLVCVTSHRGLMVGLLRRLDCPHSGPPTGRALHVPMWSIAGHRPARVSGFRLFGQSVFCCDHRMPLTRSIKTEMYLVYSSGDREVQSMVPYWSEGHVSTCQKGVCSGVPSLHVKSLMLPSWTQPARHHLTLIPTSYQQTHKFGG